MTPLLTPAGRQALGAFLGPRTLVALDYDGTLAPIVPHPPDAHMRATTRELLAQVCRRYPVVVLTGRARADVLKFIHGVGVLEVVGSHGLERYGTAPGRLAARVPAWRNALIERLRSLTGVAIEDKRLSLSVHFRHAGDPARAQRQIEQATADLEGARVFGGHKVVNVVPDEAPDKGTALIAACTRFACDLAIYIGDDRTDEDVFRLRDPRFLTVRVGADAKSDAGYFLNDQQEVDDFLRLLLPA